MPRKKAFQASLTFSSEPFKKEYNDPESEQFLQMSKKIEDSVSNISFRSQQNVSRMHYNLSRNRITKHENLTKRWFEMEDFVRSSPSVPVAVTEIQNQKQKNLRGATHAPRLVISRDA